MISEFGSENVYFALSGSTGTAGKVQTTSYVPTYNYTVNYLIQLADGTKTAIPVPTVTPKTGSLPQGTADIGPLPVVDKYVLAPSQSEVVTINSTGNTFNYYYIDDAPVISGATNITVDLASTFDNMLGISATDDEDGVITNSVKIISGSVDTKKPGQYDLIYEVVDSVGNKTSVTRTVTLNVGQTANYTPNVSAETVAYGGTIDLTDNVTNKLDLPSGTKVEDITTTVIDTTKPGDYTGQIKVTYPDGSVDIVDVPVKVLAPLSEQYTPNVSPETVPHGGTIDLTDNVTNKSDLPEGTTIEDTTGTPIDTTVPGTYEGEITVTYPDGSKDVITVPVVVKEKPLNEQYEATGGTITKPEGTTITETDILGAVTTDAPEEKVTSKVVTGTIPTSGTENKVTVEVTYTDGSKDTVEVTVNFSEGGINPTPAPTPTPAPINPTPTSTPIPNIGRTCQDDGYPVGYYWSDDAQACITDIKETPAPTPTPKPVVGLVNTNNTKNTETNTSTPTPTPTSTPVVEEELSQEEKCVVDGKYWYDEKCNDAEKTNINGDTINEEVTPVKNGGSWSLISLIATLISVLSMVMLELSKLNKTEDDGTKLTRSKTYKGIILIPSIIGVIYFFLTNNIKLPMELINKSTPISVLITVVTLGVQLLGSRWKEDKKEETNS